MLDPDVEKYIASFNQLNIDYTQMTAAEGRKLSHDMSDKRPLLPQPENIIITTQEIPLKDRKLNCRIYQPKKISEEKMPVIFYFHGGGFVRGKPSHFDDLCNVLAKHSLAKIISVDYRYAPEFPFPAALDDCYETLSYIKNKVREFDIDPEKIGVAGDSAGANLAASVAILARDQGIQLKAQLLIYPCLDNNFDTNSYREMGQGNYVLSKKLMQWYYQQYFKKENNQENPLVFPMKATDLSHLPDTLIITAPYDPLHDDGIFYAKRLQEAGVKVECLDFPDLIHGFIQFATFSQAARKANEEIAMRFKNLIF